MSAPVIDVHTHMLNNEWMKLLEKHGGKGGGRYTLKTVYGGLRSIHLDGAPFMTPIPEMFDWDLRIRNMDRVGIDVSVVSLTCPNVFWGGEKVSTKAAQVMNDELARARKNAPDRIQFFASLPWQFEKAALAELKRARKAGACGVMVLANIAGKPLTGPSFAKIWKAIDEAELPVLIHPTAPPGVNEMGMHEFQLTASIGFTADTTLAVARMIYDGFFDRYQKLKIIASHGGGTLPFLIGRMDQCYEFIPACRVKTVEKPSLHARRIFCDSVVFTDEALAMAVNVFGSGNVLYGSDYPHTIGDPIGCLARVDRLPDGQRDRVRGGNALRIFDFK
ncbi:MAG: amidohydrolase [Betaproteobacteria bacterium]|nr:amidohydrolase [Betaproteobacteria bacterium]